MSVGSAHASVRFLLRIQKPVLLAWRLVPRAVARVLLSLVRNGEGPISFGARYLCVWRLAKRCGGKVVIFPSVRLLHIGNMAIGTNVSIHEFTYIDAAGGVEIGDNVSIAHGSSILSSDHQIDGISVPIKDAPASYAAVRIGSNVWVGCGVRLLKGVRVNDGAVIGAGSVVSRDVPANTVAVGVPARPVRVRLPPGA